MSTSPILSFESPAPQSSLTTETSPSTQTMELDRDSLLKSVMTTYSFLCSLDPYLKVFPYRNSNIKTNEEAILLISLNFEAALRSRYTAHILSLKKKQMISDIQDAQYKAALERLRYKDQELIKCHQTMGELKLQNEEYSRNFQTQNIISSTRVATLENEFKELSLKMKQAELELVHERAKYEALESVNKDVSTKCHDLERQLLLAKQDMETHADLKSKLEEMSERLKSSTDDTEKRYIETKNLESQLQSVQLSASTLSRENNHLSDENTRIQQALEELHSKQLQREQIMADQSFRIKNLELDLQDLKQSHETRVHSLESKYQTILKINQVLETQLSEMYTQE